MLILLCKNNCVFLYHISANHTNSYMTHTLRWWRLEIAEQRSWLSCLTWCIQYGRSNHCPGTDLMSSSSHGPSPMQERRLPQMWQLERNPSVGGDRKGDDQDTTRDLEAAMTGGEELLESQCGAKTAQSYYYYTRIEGVCNLVHTTIYQRVHVVSNVFKRFLRSLETWLCILHSLLWHHSSNVTIIYLACTYMYSSCPYIHLHIL